MLCEKKMKRLSFILTFLGLLSITSAAAAIAGCAIVLNTGPSETEDEQMRAKMMAIFASGAVLWPLLWYMSIGRVVLYGNRGQPSILLLAGALWPQVMLGVDMRAMQDRKLDAKTNNLVSALQDDANALIGIAFAFAMMMVATYANQQKQMYSGMLMVLFALVLCIAFVVPQPISRKDSNGAFLAAAVQRVVFIYAVGFLITALCEVISVSHFIKEIA
jgi:hypothetical protein